MLKTTLVLGAFAGSLLAAVNTRFRALLRTSASVVIVLLLLLGEFALVVIPLAEVGNTSNAAKAKLWEACLR